MDVSPLDKTPQEKSSSPQDNLRRTKAPIMKNIKLNFFPPYFYFYIMVLKIYFFLNRFDKLWIYTWTVMQCTSLSQSMYLLITRASEFSPLFFPCVRVHLIRIMEAYQGHFDTFLFFIFHTLICKIYTLICKIYTLICKMVTWGLFY